MNTHLKLTKNLYDHMVEDLERPHDFAFERVGFVYAKMAKVKDGSDQDFMVFLHDYEPVDDENYIKDGSVGAKINSTAIRKSLQRVLKNNEGCFHVHMHPFRSKLGLSLTDKKGILPLVKSFKSAGPDCCHGVLLLGIDDILSYVSLPESEGLVAVSKISVIGYPMKTYER